jgi:hypothetical protein
MMDLKTAALTALDEWLKARAQLAYIPAFRDAMWNLNVALGKPSASERQQGGERLTAEARVGNVVFGVGVPERMVIEAAQSAAKHPQGGVSEEAGRELRQMIADNAGRAAFLESHPAVSKELSDLIEENERLRDALAAPAPAATRAGEALDHALIVGMLEGYVSLIKQTGQYAEWHYIPEVEAAIESLAAQPPQAPPAAPSAEQGEARTLLEQYDLDQSPEYRKGYEDGRLNGFEVGQRYAKDQAALVTQPAAPVVPQWIPVADRLPAPHTDVLCTFEMDGPDDWRIKVGCNNPDSDELAVYRGWRIYGGGWIPTHWMPLPAAPKTGGANG